MTSSGVKFRDRLHEALLIGIALSLPFPVRIASLLIILCAINWLLSPRLITRVKLAFTDRLTWMWTAFFLLHVLSIWFSDDKVEAAAIVERRSSFIAFPLLISLFVDTRLVKRICLAFAAGVGCALLYCLGQALLYYQTSGDASVFFYHELASAVRINAVYLAAYSVFSIHILLRHLPQKRPLLFPAIAFFGVACLLLNSKIFLVLLAVGTIVHLLAHARPDQRVKRFAIAVCTALVLGLCVLAVPKVRERFAAELTSDFSVLEDRTFRYDTHFTGTSLRLRIWKFSLQLMQEHNAWLTGTGTGDYQRLLNEKYVSSGMYTGNPELRDTGYLNYGPHNQYVEIALALGIPALLLFVFILFVHWKKALDDNRLLLIQLLIIVTCFMLTESALSTAKGILFFMLFSTLLIREKSASS